MTLIVQGDARRLPLADRSVHCVVTSPPYFKLRDYGVPGQVGQEETPADYVAGLVGIFREIRRVLRDDGTIWLNLGDSFNAAGRSGHGTREGRKQGTNRASAAAVDRSISTDPTLKPKDLIGIPWRVALALQSDGWFLRMDVIWEKPNQMPDSVKDRPTRSHEYIFLLSKKSRYYYDVDVVREPIAESTARDRREFYSNEPGWSGNPNVHGEKGHPLPLNPLGRNLRSVWTVATRKYKGAHFATFPPDLIEPCILAGCPAGGVTLDPFGGSMTTVMVARHLGRIGVGVDLSHDYCMMGKARVAGPYPPSRTRPGKTIVPKKSNRAKKHADGPFLFD
jgi:DNA modification methylase